jgi:hypothetical protein
MAQSTNGATKHFISLVEERFPTTAKFMKEDCTVIFGRLIEKMKNEVEPEKPQACKTFDEIRQALKKSPDVYKIDLRMSGMALCCYSPLDTPLTCIYLSIEKNSGYG